MGVVFSGLAASATPVSASGSFGKRTPANGAEFSLAEMQSKLGARFWWLYAGNFPHEYCISTVNGSCNTEWVDAKGKMYVYYADLNLQPGTTYYWQVRALIYGEYVYADGGNWWMFKVVSDSAPIAFTKVSPANGVSFHRADFRDKLGARLWWKSAGSTIHEVCFVKAPDICDTNNAALWKDTNGKLYAYIEPFSLDVGAMYRWQVRALINENYVYADAGAWSFKIVADNAPVGFGKTSPAKDVSISRGDFLSKLSSRLWWGSAGAVPYEICFVESPAVCDPNDAALWRYTNGKLYDYQDHMSLNIGSTYTWQVRALINGQYIYANNQAWQFTIVADAAPTSLKKSSPADGISFSHRDVNEKLNSGRFWWGSAGAVPHEYCVSLTNGVCTGGWVDSGGKLYVHYDELQLVPGDNGTTYYWQARALVNGQYIEADGGNWWSFKVVP